MKKLHLEALPILEKKLASGPVAEVRASLTSIIKFLRARTKSTHGEAGHRRLVAARAAQVLRILRIPESGRRYSASSSDSPLASLDDGWVPALMKGNVVPRFDWWNPHGKDVWVQLEYPQAKTFASAEVFWFENKTWDKGAKLPASWSLSFLHGDVWKPVKAKGNYSITHEKFDRVEFEPVTTRAIRLNAKGSATNRAALVEFRLGEKEPAEKKPAVDAPEPATDE